MYQRLTSRIICAFWKGVFLALAGLTFAVFFLLHAAVWGCCRKSPQLLRGCALGRGWLLWLAVDVEVFLGTHGDWMSGWGGPGLPGAALDYPAGVCWDSIRRRRSSLIWMVDSTLPARRRGSARRSAGPAGLSGSAWRDPPLADGPGLAAPLGGKGSGRAAAGPGSLLPGNGIAGKKPSSPEGALPRGSGAAAAAPRGGSRPGRRPRCPGRRGALCSAPLLPECEGKRLRFFTLSQRETEVSRLRGEQKSLPWGCVAVYILLGIALHRSGVIWPRRVSPVPPRSRPVYAICPLDP